MDKKINLIKLLSLFGEDHEGLWWRANESITNVDFFIDCNDIFFWASADCEAIESNEDLNSIIEARKECYELTGSDYHGDVLWACRKRKERPQGAFYSYLDEKLWPLFNSCGEPKEVGIGNPYEIGEYKK